MLEAIEHSDVIVYVQTRPLGRAGALRFVAATPEARFLRIFVRVRGRSDEMIAWLGHELQHAVEIAAERDVKDENGVLALYRRIGLVGARETQAAKHVRAQVLAEVRGRVRPGSPMTRNEEADA